MSIITKLISTLLMISSSLIIASGLTIVKVLPISDIIDRLAIDYLTNTFTTIGLYSIIYGSIVFIGSVLMFAAIKLGRYIVLGTLILELLLKVVAVIIAGYSLDLLVDKLISFSSLFTVLILWYLSRPGVKQEFIQEEIVRNSGIVDILIEETKKINTKTVIYGTLFLFFGILHLISPSITHLRALRILMSALPHSFIPIPGIELYLLDGVLLSIAGLLILLRKFWHTIILLVIFFTYNAVTILGLGIIITLHAESFNATRGLAYLCPFMISIAFLKYLTSLHSRIEFKRHKYKNKKLHSTNA